MFKFTMFFQSLSHSFLFFFPLSPYFSCSFFVKAMNLRMVDLIQVDNDTMTKGQGKAPISISFLDPFFFS